MSTDENVPSDQDMRWQYVTKRMHDGATRTHAEQEYTRWLDAHDARVHRDAAREALDGLAEHIDWTASQFLGIRVGSQKAQDVRDYRDEHYPEETP